MNTRDAMGLIRGAIPGPGGTWADLGAGDGMFTRALVGLLGPTSRIYAVDRDANAVTALERWAATDAANVIPVVADFTRPDLPGFEGSILDGMLFANALHFVRDADMVLARLATWLRPGGRVVFVEYDRGGASRWVPYPIPVARLPALAASAGLSTPVITATRPSAFGGNLYAAAADRLAEDTRSTREGNRMGEAASVTRAVSPGRGVRLARARLARVAYRGRQKAPLTTHQRIRPSDRSDT